VADFYCNCICICICIVLYCIALHCNIHNFVLECNYSIDRRFFATSCFNQWWRPGICFAVFQQRWRQVFPRSDTGTDAASTRFGYRGKYQSSRGLRYYIKWLSCNVIVYHWNGYISPLNCSHFSSWWDFINLSKMDFWLGANLSNQRSIVEVWWVPEKSGGYGYPKPARSWGYPRALLNILWNKY